MAAKKKAAPKARPAKKAPRRKKQATSSAPGESAEAHKWLMESNDGAAQAADAILEIEGPTEITVLEGRHPETGQFVKGYRGGPGRQKGSRNKFAEAFITDFYHDWLEHGMEAIAIVRVEKPDQYLKVAAAILPKQMDVRVSEFSELTEDALDARLRELSSEMSVALDILRPQRERAN